MKIRWILVIFIIFVGIVIMLSGCEKSSDIKTAVLSSTPTQTKSTDPSIKLTDTPLAITPTKNPTTGPTTELTSTVIPTALTSLPDWVENLRKSNGGCKFPCWGGSLTVGRTSKEDTLAWFDANQDLYDFEDGRIEKYTYIYEEADYWYAVSLFIKDEVLFAIDTGYRWSLSHLFSQYGPPTEIWTHVMSTNIFGEEGNFRIALYYQEIGFIAYMVGNTELGEFPEICPETFDRGFINVLLVNPRYIQRHSFSDLIDLWSEQYYLDPIINTFANQGEETSTLTG
jgi:hypothetical protein